MSNMEFRWLQLRSVEESPVKEKPSESLQPLISFPVPSSVACSNFSCSTSPRRRCHHLSSTTSLATTNRVRPYPLLRRRTPPRIDIRGIMSNTPASGTWSHPGTRDASNRSHGPAHRRSPDPDDNPYSIGHSFLPEGYVNHWPELRPASSNSNLTSSLTGAMGETSLSRHSRSPPSRTDNLYNTNEGSANPSLQQIPLAIQNASYSGVPGLDNIGYQNLASQTLSAANVQYQDFGSTTNRNSSPDSMSSGSSTFCPVLFDNGQFAMHSANQSSLQSRPSGAGYAMVSQPTSSEEQLRVEMEYLRRKNRELEAECRRNRAALEAMSESTSNAESLTSPLSPTFLASWKVRTETRKSLFCSLNRAGNALCAWHDSRRERRAYPPRNAPPGYLNCGCTHEEALFEESLARHNVGSYHPGENVRMDPALRNPLLRLLQKRYGYQDGDFERDPVTGEWVEGEGAAFWEQQARSGSTSRRRVESDRH